MGNKKACIAASLVFLILLIFSIIVGIFFYRNMMASKESATDGRETVVGVTAAAVQVKIDHLVNIASLIASNNDIVTDAAKGQWESAANVTRDLQNNVNYYDTYLDRVVLIDTNGIEQAAYPELSGGIGADFSKSSYFQQVMGGAPYGMSNVVLRASQPKIDIINIVVPISDKGKIVGVVGLQIPTINFLEFGSDASLGTYGFVYIVDSAGNIVAHPKLSSEGGNIINVASMPIVQKVLAGNTGSGESFSTINDERTVTTYAPVSVYKWGVILQEPYNEIFGNAENILRDVELGLIAFIVLDFVVAYFVFWSFKKKENNA